MLKPLQQWVCDFCGEIIETSEQGWLEWLEEEQGDGSWKSYGFKIVHHASYSPRRLDGEHCYFYSEPGRGKPKRPGCLVADNHLNEFSGDSAIPFSLMFIDPGPFHAKSYSGPKAKDFREWTELARRLTIPYYEEARFYWSKAEAAGFLEGANEIWIYLPTTLRKIINLYGPRSPMRRRSSKTG